jgi:hypothetical protein
VGERVLNTLSRATPLTDNERGWGGRCTDRGDVRRVGDCVGRSGVQLYHPPWGAGNVSALTLFPPRLSGGTWRAIQAARSQHSDTDSVVLPHGWSQRGGTGRIEPS